MTGGWLAARVAAATAARDDFKRQTDAYIDQGADRPDFVELAWRLSSVLDLLLAELGDARVYAYAEPEPCPECGRDPRAEQHQIGCPVWEAGGPDGARQLAEVRALIDAFDWEHDDRLAALEHIWWIVDRGDR